jgi:hypothetical protein
MLAPLRSPPSLAPAEGLPLDAARRAPRGFIVTIARHEVGRLAASFRWPAVSFLLVLLLALPAVTGSLRHRAERATYAATLADYVAALQSATVDDLAELRHPALRPPWRLSFVADGGQSATPDLYERALSPLVAPELRRAQRGNHRLPGPAPLDWLFAVRVVLSIAALLLGHDAICGERQRGSLKLLLAQPVARWKILAGKLTALWICLAVPFAAGCGLALGLLVALGEVPLSGADLAKAAAVLLLGLWAAALFALVALVVSAASRSPATSLSVLALLWVGAVVVVPALGGLLAHRLAPIASDGEIERRSAQVEQRIAREHAGREGRWRSPEWAAEDGYLWERASAAAEVERRGLHDEVHWWAVGRKLRQAELARRLAAVSPPSLVHDLGERLTGSGLCRDRAFLDQARAFFPLLAERVRRLDAADPESPHILFFRGYLSRQTVPSEAIPRFAFSEAPPSAGLAAAGPMLVLLGLETLVLALLAGALFARLEPR